MSNKNKRRGNLDQRFRENMVRRMGTLILHTIGATILVIITVLMGIECASNDGYWALILSLIVCAAATVACIASVVTDACNIMLVIENLYNTKEY